MNRKSLVPAAVAALLALATTAGAAFADGGGDMQVPLAVDALAAVGALGTLAASATAFLRRR